MKNAVVASSPRHRCVVVIKMFPAGAYRMVRMIPPLKQFCMTAGLHASEVIDAVKCHIQCVVCNGLTICQHFAVNKLEPCFNFDNGRE